ncbi:hypothetical protein JW758_02085, partial [Candidatus Peregrinibacteria bacterium]|nr:hypothetical protein [Candidatus Peregrinibacteria bacterium]
MFFGDVRNAIMGLSDIGDRVAKCWQEIPNHFPFVRLYEWIVMPNHLHGVLHFVGTRNFASVRLDDRGAGNFASVRLDDRGAGNF